MHMNAFLCHSSADSAFVLQVASHLRRYVDIPFDVFAFEDPQREGRDFVGVLDERLRNATHLVVFVGRKFSKWQVNEVNAWIRLESARKRPRKAIIVAISGQQKPQQMPHKLSQFAQGDEFLPDTYRLVVPHQSFKCARDIVQRMGLAWQGADGLPHNPHLFDFEKRVIDFFILKSGVDLSAPLHDKADKETYLSIRQRLFDGCPDRWPEVRMLEGSRTKNRLPQSLSGVFRPHDSMVVASALTRLDCARGELSFCEAGPREELYYPQPSKQLNVGILVSGGIAPGINAVIDAIVQRHWLYRRYHPHDLQIFGFENGWLAFNDIDNFMKRLCPGGKSHPDAIIAGENATETSEYVTEGGSILGTARDDEIRDPETRTKRLAEIASQLFHHNIDILYVIGGDGSMKAAHALSNVAHSMPQWKKRPLSVVAIPKSMDNDIMWVWQSFGFASAVQKAREIVEQLHTEIKSNPRLCVVQLYGSDSGFVVSHTVAASATGHCDLALIPEQPFTMVGVATHLAGRICASGRRIPYGMVVMAETAIPEDALECLGERKPRTHKDLYEKVAKSITLSDAERAAILNFDQMRLAGRRIEGQTDDTLRQASLRLVTQALPILMSAVDVSHNTFVPDWTRLRLLVNEPRHLLRAIPPSTSDITTAQRLGVLAVDNSLAGYTDFMISNWLTEYVLVPLKLVVLGRKRIPPSGMFWKSVLAQTGQPASL